MLDSHVVGGGAGGGGAQPGGRYGGGPAVSSYAAMRNTAVLAGYGNFYGDAAARVVSPHRGAISAVPVASRRAVNNNSPPHQYYGGGPSAPRAASPTLGSSATIRQILERMQAERSAIARSGSESHAADGLEPYRFVAHAIRRSQSPPLMHSSAALQRQPPLQGTTTYAIGGQQPPYSNGNVGAARAVALPMGVGSFARSRSTIPAGRPNGLSGRPMVFRN